MSLNAHIDNGRKVGPGDLNALPRGTVVIVAGKYNPDQDAGPWAPMLGLAVLNGVTVRWDDASST